MNSKAPRSSSSGSEAKPTAEGGEAEPCEDSETPCNRAELAGTKSVTSLPVKPKLGASSATGGKTTVLATLKQTGVPGHTAQWGSPSFQ